MADVFTKKKRSWVMAQITSKGNRNTEIALLNLLKAARITGWRRHLSLPGKPDFTFCKEKIVVFVDGCFWHGCPKCYRAPSSNKEFWTAKVERNRKRDKVVGIELRKRGWKVIRIWEHSLKKTDGVIRRITKSIG